MSEKRTGRGGARPGTGPKPSKFPKKPRSFYASDPEWEQINTNAKKAGKKTSEYIRDMALNEGKNNE